MYHPLMVEKNTKLRVWANASEPSIYEQRKKMFTPYFPRNTDCIMGILTMVYEIITI